MRRSHQSITVCNEERSVDYSTLRGTFGPSIQYNTVQSVSSSRLQTQNTVVHTHISHNGGGVFSLFPLFLSFPSFPFFSPSFSLFFSLFSLFFLSFSSLFLSFVPTPKNRHILLQGVIVICGWNFGCCCLKHWGQVLSQALSGTVGHCRALLGAG